MGHSTDGRLRLAFVRTNSCSILRQLVRRINHKHPLLSIKLSRLLVSMTVIQAGSWLLLLLLFFSSFLVFSRRFSSVSRVSVHLQPLYHSLLQSSPLHLPPYPEPFWQGRLPCSSRPPLSQLETNVHKRFAVSGADKSGVVCFSRRNWRLQQLGATDTFIRPRAPCQTNAAGARGLLGSKA